MTTACVLLQKFKIQVEPVDDGTPRLITNMGLDYLEYLNGVVSFFSSVSLFHVLLVWKIFFVSA